MPFLLCASWVGVISFVVMIFIHLVTARWAITLGISAAGVVAALFGSLVGFSNLVMRSCVPTGAALAWLAAAWWAWHRKQKAARATD